MSGLSWSFSVWGARKLWDLISTTTTAAGGDGAGALSWIESGSGLESIGETRPGDKIRRGSIRPTKLNPDLALRGELGTELEVGLEKGSNLWRGLE